MTKNDFIKGFENVFSVSKLSAVKFLLDAARTNTFNLKEAKEHVDMFGNDARRLHFELSKDCKEKIKRYHL